MGLFSFLTQELAIDLGTANTLIIHKDKVVVDEPSIIALERNTGNVIAIGRDAMLMYGKENEGIRTIRPLKDGVIADFQAAEHMIRGMIKMMNQRQQWISPQLKIVLRDQVQKKFISFMNLWLRLLELVLTLHFRKEI
jgi:rod shape-determining protein MreB